MLFNIFIKHELKGIIIYPNKIEYASVTFKLPNVIPYSAIYEAKVEGDELNPETGELTFELLSYRLGFTKILKLSHWNSIRVKNLVY